MASVLLEGLRCCVAAAEDGSRSGVTATELPLLSPQPSVRRRGHH